MITDGKHERAARQERSDRKGVPRGVQAGNWPRPSCTADLAIIYEAPDLTREVLLIKRGGHPSLGKWALPGGFVNPDETVEHAASRELLEETGVGGLRPTLICESSDPGRDPRGWTITSLFGAVVRSKPVTDAGDDAPGRKVVRDKVLAWGQTRQVHTDKRRYPDELLGVV